MNNSPRYQVVPHPISTILTWVKSGVIAIPEIQRPFVWDNSQVRDLLDSLYKGYPVGYLISWSNPNVRLKDGGVAAGKRILIDGQQRVTAMMASLLGMPVINDEYKVNRIKIAFNPSEERFEVQSAAIQKGKEWISDISELFLPDVHLLNIVEEYVKLNPKTERNSLFDTLHKLVGIQNNMVGIIELSDELDIETVTEIFIRVNSQGTQLSQADFAMSKIASNETYQGNVLRKAIDYFCRLAVSPDFVRVIQERDPDFAKTDYFAKMKWLGKDKEDLYDPKYTDMLRVAFTSEFGRGKLQDLVALLSGRNFETKEYQESIIEESFATLRKGILNFMNETQFQRFIMIMKSAGLVDSSMVSSQNVIDFAYIVYLTGRAEGVNQGLLETAVRQWLIMPMLTGRFSGTPETAFEQDIKQIKSQGILKYTKTVVSTELNDAFWELLLPQQLETSSINSPYWSAYCAAQVALEGKGFLSKEITVRTLIENKSDIHHIYPRNYLRKSLLGRRQYNQIANFVHTQQEINIAIGDKAPSVYFAELEKQVNSGKLKYGSITSESALIRNLEQNCIPVDLYSQGELDYEIFLERRRVLMSKRMKHHFEGLGELSVE
jgi:hypothetical protein